MHRESNISPEEDMDEIFSTLMNTTEIDEEIINQGCLVVVNQFGTQKSKFLIDPDSSYKGLWDLFNFLLIVYQSIVTPFRISFDVPPTGFMFYVELFMDLIFILDILMSFNVGYYHKGTKIMLRNKVLFNYIFGWMILDIIASFPYSYAMDLFIKSNPRNSTSSVASAPRLLRLLKIVKFLRILKIVRVLKLRRLLHKLDDYLVNDFMYMLMDFLKLLVFIFLLSHWIG